jgi:diacylglycerol kinase (ATP)
MMSRRERRVDARPTRPIADAMTSPADAENAHKGKRGLRRIVNAFFYSMSGLSLAYRHEDAFRQEILLAAILLPTALLLPVTPLERVLLIGTVLLVLIVELLNSSVEAAIDRIGPETHHLSKRAKDLGSAAVLLALVLLATAWLLIAGPILVDVLRAKGP